MKTRGLLHLNLNVSDLARSVRFRRELFGLEVVATSDGDEEIDGRHVRISQVVLRTPGTRELFALTQAAPRPAPRVPPKLSARAPFKTAAFDHSATFSGLREGDLRGDADPGDQGRRDHLQRVSQ